MKEKLNWDSVFFSAWSVQKCMRKFTCLKTISVSGLSNYFLIMDLGAGGLGGALLRQTPYSSEWFSCGLHYLPHTQGNHAETESQSGTIGLSIPLVGCPHEQTVQRQRNLLDQHKHEPAGQDLSGGKVLTLDHRFDGPRQDTWLPNNSTVCRGLTWIALQ